MTAKEKAMDIAMKFDKYGQTDNAVKCALICVDVILNDVGAKDWELDTGTNTNYWQEVKQEINKL